MPERLAPSLMNSRVITSKSSSGRNRSLRSSTSRVAVQRDLVSRRIIGIDRFVPVCSPEYLGKLEKSNRNGTALSLIAYPSTLFLGQIQREILLPKTPYPYVIKISLGLTQAVQQSIESGLGFGWLPSTAVAASLLNGRLLALNKHGFPDTAMELTMLHLNSKSAKKLSTTLMKLLVQLLKCCRERGPRKLLISSAS